MVKKVLKKFDPVTYFLIWHDPYSNMNRTALRQTFWYNFMKIEEKLWPLEGEQGFKAIWPILEIHWDIW